MAGFLRRLAAGVLQAGSNYYGEQYRKSENDRMQQVMMQREQALAKFRHGLAEESAEKQVERQKEVISHSATENRVSNAAELQSRAQIDNANADRDFKRWKEKNNIELSNDKARILFEAETKAKFDAGEGDPITHWDIDANTGTKVGFTKSGRVFDTGVKVPAKAAGGAGSAFDSMLSDAMGEGGEAPETGTGALIQNRTPKPGDVIVDKQGRKMKMNANGRWVPVAN